MITKKIKEIYKCEFCTRWFQLKHRAEDHEEKCNKNPKNKILCFDCVYFTYKYMEIRNKKIWFCSKYDTFLGMKEKTGVKAVIRLSNINDCFIHNKTINKGEPK